MCFSFALQTVITMSSHYREIGKLLAMEQEHFEDEVCCLVSFDGFVYLSIFRIFF